ncbi:Ureohydrolase [Aspergillus floccosus]
MAQRLTALSKYLPKPSRLGVVAASFSGGGPRPGAEQGPGSLLNYGLRKHLQSSFDSVSITECNPQMATDEDIDQQNGINRASSVSHFTEILSHEVYTHARQGLPVLTLGGDHSIAIGTLTGMAKAVRERLMGQEIAVIYVDAHADINTPETSPSGNIHGMPVAFATGIARRVNEGPLSWIKNEHLINPNKVVYLGLRDVDDAEWRTIHDHRIKAFDMREIREKGIERVMDMTLAYIGNETPIHVSYDIDGLDPEWAPCTTLPVSGGLSLTEGTYISRRVLETGSLVGMDLVELNPSVSSEKLDLTLQTGSSLVYSAYGMEQV